MKVINILFFFFFISHLNSQVSLYQELITGGVTGDGYDPYFSNDIGQLNVQIESGSTIKRAFLFTVISQNPSPTVLYFNTNTILLNPQEAIINDFTAISSGATLRIRTLISDVTSFINPSENSYILIPPQNQTTDIFTYGGYSNFYLLIIYENSSLPKTAVSIFANNKNSNYYVNYPITNLNPIDLNYNAAFTLNSSWFCDTLGDGSYVKINNQDIGLIGGMEDNTNWYCTGSKGSFYYQNNTTYGIGNDIANTTMAGPDVLANIESYLTSTTSFDVSFTYQQGNSGGSKTNPIHQLFLAYTSTCDTFSVSTTPDTNICIGETLQLPVTGGQAYEWLPATDLSCSDCPNPIFTGDTSRFYTVRIWNNDSCSVVRPIKINVRPKPVFSAINSTPSHCGTNNGSVSIGAISGTQTPITYILNDTLIQSGGTFSSLASGSYTFNITDGFGCVSNDTTVIVGEINTTVANFTVSPTYGVVPLAVDFTNTSLNATDYLWSINSTDQGNNLSSYTCDTSGLYTIELIAWQYDPSCADTVVMTVLAVDQIIIPTAFTPDNDGVNDRWEIPNIKNIYPNHLVRIYNRWGALIYEAPEGKYSTYPWKGIYEDEELPVGSYYFIIDPNDGVTEVIKGVVSIVR